MRNASFCTISIVVLITGLYFANYGSGVTEAHAGPSDKGDPYAGVIQSWDKNLPSGSRFTVLSAFANAAVRDNNTGLVWEQAVDGSTRTWVDATMYCLNKTVGGTRRWRLPSVVELNSLLDRSLPSPFIPANIFSNVQQASYWSATTFALGTPPDSSWLVDFATGTVPPPILRANTLCTWCVRGPMNADMY